MSTNPILGFDELAQAQSQPHIPINAATRALSQGAQFFVLFDKDLTAPPSSPDEGDAYIVGPSATGAWQDHDGEIAYYASGWSFLTPREGWFAFMIDEAILYYYDFSGGWTQWSSGGGGGGGVTIQLSCSDLVSTLGANTSVAYVRAPADFTLSAVRASLLTASSSGAVTVDINVNGSTILSTKLTIDASETTSETAATPAIISNTAITEDDIITVDIDNAGSGATGLIVTLIGA